MINGFLKAGRLEEATRVFEGMVERDVVSWSSMVDGYCKKGRIVEARGLLDSMPLRNVVAWTAMIDGFGYMFEANRIFQMMNKKDVVSWNSLIAGYIQHDEIEEAYRLFEEMPGKDVVSWTTVISGFSAIGKVQKAIQLFKMMPEKDDVAWTAVISGFVNNRDYEEAFHWFIEMLKEAVKPNSLTLSSLLSASAGLATLNQGLQIHAHALKMDMQFDLFVQNSLVSMYSKCGNVAEAYQVFTSINAPNLISFNSMITGFSQNGRGEQALQLFSKMEKESWEPNEITFLGILSACTHVGLVEEGWKYFNLMKYVYNMEPSLDHYVCMVDLLGRAGLLDEAINLIHSMPFEPHAGVWGALLGASRVHFRLDLAKLAAQHLRKLEPNSAIPYVVLSELYNIAGKKKDGDRVRMAKNPRNKEESRL
ncbi:hypothetical protein GH714_026746 [Hevea brasiliensis]|uniref:Pentacotripeptide-repeat region of PRORP domain-containing protein n=1 Tax=Hevea brasiliensis TaxID=3981 RepID=A0A6A6MPJ6_HEVBR|nr:hypothetical protein GH714_026746 [Hevea brasiliensis]